MSPLPLLLIDGRAGSGKTTLAAYLAQLTGAQLVHMDDLTPGWSGLAQSSVALHQLLTTSEAKRYDWHLGELNGTIQVDLGTPLIVEGCGSITRDTIRFAQQSVWMECPIEIRQQRAIDRDGDMFSEFWEHWAAQELDHLNNHQPNLLAAMVCDGEQDKLQECSQLLSSFPEAEATSGQS